MVHCKVCRKPIARPEDGTLVGAFGRPWFAVHQGPCVALVKAGAHGAILGALHGIKYVLRKKAPVALTLLESTTQAVRQMRQENAHG